MLSDMLLLAPSFPCNQDFVSIGTTITYSECSISCCGLNINNLVIMKQLIVLRPCKDNNRYRLGLYMADFNQFAKDKTIGRLLVDLGDGVID